MHDDCVSFCTRTAGIGNVLLSKLTVSGVRTTCNPETYGLLKMLCGVQVNFVR